MEPVYAPVMGMIRAAFRVMAWHVDVQGMANLPRDGGAVIAANHISYLNPFVLAVVAKRRGRYARLMGKREVFSMAIIGSLLRQMRHIPVYRGQDQGRALTTARDLLRQGEFVALYPEVCVAASRNVQ